MVLALVPPMPPLRSKVIRLEQLERESTGQSEQSERPKTRGECESGQRPCPYASCRYHLALDVKWTGAIVENFDAEDPGDRATCALDVAAHGGASTEEVGRAIGLSRERIRQIEEHALHKILPMMARLR